MTIPRATYRVQFHAGFTLAAGTALVPYLHALGISHLYASPLLKARPGSTHGYDVIDPTQLNPELGTDADFQQLADTLAAHGMGLLLDIVPNHMGVLEADNPWWLDVLENGPAAEHAPAFDIEWQPPQHELRGKLLLPVLGQGFGAALEAGELQPVFEPARGQFVVHYFEHRLPIDPADHAALLRLAPLPAEASEADIAAVESLSQGFERLPPRDTPDAIGRATRQREGAGLQRALAQLHERAPWAPAWLEACAQRLSGTPGDAASFDALEALLARQAFRLAHWRSAGDIINYRRFFDINGLAGLRIEDPAVFDAAHALILAWVRQGRVQGLRIDHPDGLADPAGYFAQLRERCGDETYLVVEKIVADDEPWPRHWPVQGDTGYRFSNQAVGVFVDGTHAAAFDALYAAFTGEAADFDAEVDAAKRGTMTLSLAADLRQLAEMAHDIALDDRHTRDFTRQGLQASIVEYAAAMDCYRSYVTDSGPGPGDAARIEKAAALARSRVRASLVPYLDFIRGLLLHPGGEAGRLPSPRGDAVLRFVRRLQQFTAPVMAKAMEDTAFYRYHRLVMLNDVGGDPRRFGTPPAVFHAANAARQKETPHTLLGGSTHDSKRSEDVRARLAVLSEMPARWAETLQRWHEMAAAQLRIGGGGDAIAAGDELLLFQTLVGLWPQALDGDDALATLRERVAAYMLKAVREAKLYSSWLDGNADYEAAVERSVALLLARLEPNPLLSDLRRFVAEIAPFGACNSLAVLALKLTSPGVPDIYQGNEVESLALVDPDNRRPVDHAALASTLQALAEPPAPSDIGQGPHKLWLTRALLQWRAAHDALLRDGDYRPLELSGAFADAAFAFARSHGSGGDEWRSITVVTRLPWRVAGGDFAALVAGGTWGDTALHLPAEWDGGAWLDVVNRRTIAAAATWPLAELLRGWPLAVLSYRSN